MPNSLYVHCKGLQIYVKPYVCFNFQGTVPAEDIYAHELKLIK